MFIHRNSIKRLYHQDSVYFITTNIYKNIHYFSEEIFCRLFIDNLKICKQLKGFKLYGFVIIPWHVHLMIKPGKRFNISEVMHNLKRVTALQINWIMGLNPESVGEVKSPPVGEDIYPRLPEYCKKFYQKYGHPQYQIPQFKWQQSFHDRRIRNEHEFYAFERYIANNPIKHGLTDDQYKYHWSSLNPEYYYLIDY